MKARLDDFAALVRYLAFRIPAGNLLKNLVCRFWLQLGLESIEASNGRFKVGGLATLRGRTEQAPDGQ
jgi:hypothetical protein